MTNSTLNIDNLLNEISQTGPIYFTPDWDSTFVEFHSDDHIELKEFNLCFSYSFSCGQDFHNEDWGLESTLTGESWQIFDIKLIDEDEDKIDLSDDDLEKIEKAILKLLTLD